MPGRPGILDQYSVSFCFEDKFSAKEVKHFRAVGQQANGALRDLAFATQLRAACDERLEIAAFVLEHSPKPYEVLIEWLILSQWRFQQDATLLNTRHRKLGSHGFYVSGNA